MFAPQDQYTEKPVDTSRQGESWDILPGLRSQEPWSLGAGTVAYLQTGFVEHAHNYNICQNIN